MTPCHSNQAADAGDRFCARCGAILRVFCPLCAHDGAAADQFCRGCGASLEGLIETIGIAIQRDPAAVIVAPAPQQSSKVPVVDMTDAVMVSEDELSSLLEAGGDGDGDGDGDLPSGRISQDDLDRLFTGDA